MKKVLVAFAAFAALLAACAPSPTPTATAPPVLTIMTHDSFDISEEVIATFEDEHDAQVEILPSGDAGLMVSQAILSVENPLADVLFGVDNTLLSRALEAGIFEPYQSPLLEEISDALELDGEYRALPVDYGDVCLNYDRGWFAEQGIAPPAGLEDLTAPEYAGLTVAENPASSSPGLAFMLTTIAAFGESGDYTWLDYWADLRENDLLVTDGWSEAYYEHFTYPAEEGTRPIVVSYASSPPAEVYFAEAELEEAPTGVVTSDGSCFRQIEFVGILKGTPNRELAEAWVDFMLSETFQEDIPLHMFVFPANENAELPDVFARFAVIPDNPAEVSPEAIEADRSDWIEAWTETTLR
ncbi:MAG: thiamine ABC transporter substrate-binding protein [Anaerolineae bacterium]|jgi:thiamine transport system substrate-binding protein